MRRTSLTTALVAGVAAAEGISSIAAMPSVSIDPYYRIDGGFECGKPGRHYTPKFKPALRRARNKRAKKSRARNR